LYITPQVNAGGVVYENSSEVFSSILHKDFQKDKYNGKIVPRWISFQVNLPDFELNSARKQARKEKVEFNREYQRQYILKIFQKLLNSFHDGWKYYFLAEYEQIIFSNSINLGNGIYVYEKKPQRHNFKVIPIVRYCLNSIPDIEVTFKDAGNLDFRVVIPEVDLSPVFNFVDYRGEELDKFFKLEVFEKFEEAFKTNNRFK
jgi:hypothetical protein